MIRIAFGLLIILGCFNLQAQTVPMYVGAYTSNGSNGVYIYDFDERSGQSKLVDSITMSNPSFVARKGNLLYAVNENANGTISAIDLRTNKVLNQLSTIGASPCHVSLSPIEPLVVVSNYTGGSLVLYSLKPDGSLSKQEDAILFTKSSINTKSQSSSHIHSAFFTEDGKFLFVCDLGADLVYKIAVIKEGAGYKLDLVEEISTKLGGGPRHLLISNDANRLYVVLELTGELQVLEKSNDEWTSKQILPIHKADFVGVQGAADLKKSKDGKFIYATNRGEANQLVVYKVNRDGLLEIVQVLPVEGNSPRNVQLSPNEKWVIVSNQLTGNLSFFSRNKKTGKLESENLSQLIPSAVCVIF